MCTRQLVHGQKRNSFSHADARTGKWKHSVVHGKSVSMTMQNRREECSSFPGLCVQQYKSPLNKGFPAFPDWKHIAVENAAIRTSQACFHRQSLRTSVSRRWNNPWGWSAEMLTARWVMGFFSAFSISVAHLFPSSIDWPLSQVSYSCESIWVFFKKRLFIHEALGGFGGVVYVQWRNSHRSGWTKGWG